MRKCPKCKQTEYVSLDNKATKTGVVIGGLGSGVLGLPGMSAGAEIGVGLGSFFGPVGMAFGAVAGGFGGFLSTVALGVGAGAKVGNVIDESFQTYYCSYCNETFKA